jgi:hypothetical protein
MANGLTTDWSKLSKELEELTKKKNELKPRISFGQGPTFTTTGTQTASQDIAQGYKRIDPRELTPFQKEMIGGEEEIAKRKAVADNLIASETTSVKPLSITGEKKVEVKAAPKSATKAKDKEPKPDIWRVMMKGGDASKDTFYDNEDDARNALEAERARRKAEREYMVQTLGEAETLKRLGKEQKNIGTVAGVRFPAKSREEASILKEQYMQQSRAMLPKSDETEKDRIMRQVMEVNPKATKAQQENYYNTLTASRAKSAEREAASKERASKFRSDIAAKRASEEQLNQYNKQLSTLKRAYREARMAGDYVEQYRIGDFINSYTAGVPKEMGARQKASQRGIIENRNKELAEMVRRDREARIAAERASRANPDYQQFNSQPTYQPTSYPEQFANNLTFSNL